MKAKYLPDLLDQQILLQIFDDIPYHSAPALLNIDI